MADLFTHFGPPGKISSDGSPQSGWRRRWRAPALGVLAGLLGLGVVTPAPVSASAPVHVTSISPNAGPNTGGTPTVDILGSGFLGSSQVKICNVTTGSVTFVSSTHLTALPPAVSPAYGACLLEVDNVDGGRSPELVAFNDYEELPLPSASNGAAGAATHGLPGPNDAQVDVFIWGGNDNNLHHDFHTNLNPAWQEENLGGTLASAPAAVSWGGENRIDVFVKGTDNTLYHKWWDGGAWSGWESLGGNLASDPTVTSWSTGRLDVFVRGTDNQLWHRYYAGGWSGWEPLGGTLASAPGGVSWGPDRIDIFVRGTDNSVWHKWWGGAWGGWESIGGTISQAPAVTSRGSGDLEVYALGSGINLYHRPYSSGWLDWRAEGPYWNGIWAYSPGVTSQSFVIGPEIFMFGGNKHLYHGVTFGPQVGFPSSRTRKPLGRGTR